jgi:hypothetical protein
MQTFAQQELVHVLELAKSKGRGEKPERNRGMVHSQPDNGNRRIQHAAMSWGKAWQLIEREPCVGAANRRRRSGWDQTSKRH